MAYKCVRGNYEKDTKSTLCRNILHNIKKTKQKMGHKGKKLYLTLGAFVGISFVFMGNINTNCKTYVTKRTETTRIVSENYSTTASVPHLIQLRDIHGNIILNKIANKNWNEPLIKWKPREELLAFVHIGKSGGTSMEKSLRKSILMENNCAMQCINHTTAAELKKGQPNCPEIKPMLCRNHFDWTAIKTGEEQGHKMAPIILFRDPIERVVSHFYFAKGRLPWTEGKKIRNQTLGEYLNDKESMMDTYSIWHDGQVGGCNCSHFFIFK